MPRAFLVVKKSQQAGAISGAGAIPAGAAATMDLAKPDSLLKRPRVEDSSENLRYLAPLSGVVEQPRPSSASPASYASSEGSFSPGYESREAQCSPPSHPPTLGIPTSGMTFTGLPSMYELAAKRQRLSHDLMQEKPCTISPGSTTSETGSDASVVPSPCKSNDLRKYMMFPHPHDSVTQGEELNQPLSPLHHLVRHHPHHQHPLPFAPFHHLPMPYMRTPMFLPQHFKPFPQGLGTPTPTHTPTPTLTIPPPTQPKEVQKDTKESKPSPKPKLSHNIEDLLARSPPKTKKPIDTTIEQPKPVIVQNISPKPQRVPVAQNVQSPVQSPMHKLVAMEEMYKQHQHHLPQSPKTGSFAPVSTSPSSPRSKSRSRNLEEDFKKHYLESILPEALRQRQQRLAEEYQEILRLQNAQLAMEQSLKAEAEIKHNKLTKDRFQADINRNALPNYAPDYGKTVFPGRFDEEKDSLNPALAERLSPSTLDNLPVDFSNASQKRSGPPRFQCDGCKKSYSTLNGLSKHKEFHCVSHVKKEFSCKQCAKTYTSLGALKMHIRTHTLPCKCQLCGKAFSRPWLLQGHIRTHTGEKPFSCPHCARSFADRSNLRAHLQTHTDIKRYSCETCTKTFSRMSLLTKHRENGCGQVSMMHH